MSRFKDGDRVRYIRKDTNWGSFKYGREYVVGGRYNRDGIVGVMVDDQGEENGYKEEYFEIVTPPIPSPIVTEAVTRIEPGVYGRLSIAKQHSEDKRRILIGLANQDGHVPGTTHGWSFDELCAAIEVLTAVKTHLESQKL